MKVKLQDCEATSPVLDPSCNDHYPACLSKANSYDKFFHWGSTRQGKDYWKDKLGNPVFNLSGRITSHYYDLKDTLTHSDKVYLSLIAFQRKHGVRTYEFSSRAGEGVCIQ